ncbi:MAG: acyl-CoA synthetase [Rhodobacterales bacterium CG2_30_65_12]|nr:MAG: acyl-CoA synthetase [Rhodobacterales bacterium CG2_30_65_12]
MGWLHDEAGLEKNAANFVSLTPLSHLNRAAALFPDKIAIIDGLRRFSYADYHARASRLASALEQAGVASGDVVATLLPNILAQAEAHWGVPATGAVLNTINTRLDVGTVAYILDHGGAKVVLADSAFLGLTEAAVAQIEGPAPLIVEVADPASGVPASGRHPEYESFIANGDRAYPWHMPEDEWESLALNYTSGTTGRPKGVVYSHRGAYLHTLGLSLDWGLTRETVYLTIVPLFHCNNWIHTWSIPALGGTVVCCRDITAKAIYDAIADEGVTHFGGAPIVLNMIVNAKAEQRRTFDHVVNVYTAGAPPPAAILAGIEPLGFSVTQTYGLTETYGHVVECRWKDEWAELPDAERYAMKARTGVAQVIEERVTVIDPETMQEVPADGDTVGEVMMRGNVVMKGYLKNPDATAEAFRGGYFHSGDIAFKHPDGYIKITDRAKDVIISGGENVSSVEVESALMHHPAVSLCAVVAKSDEKWGEVPCAFVELKEGASASAEELIAFARERLAGFKTPKMIVFEDLPKTSTGKIQKFELRKRVRAL